MVVPHYRTKSHIFESPLSAVRERGPWGTRTGGELRVGVGRPPRSEVGLEIRADLATADLAAEDLVRVGARPSLRSVPSSLRYRNTIVRCRSEKTQNKRYRGGNPRFLARRNL